jgi:hypothetical protein
LAGDVVVVVVGVLPGATEVVVAEGDVGLAGDRRLKTPENLRVSCRGPALNTTSVRIEFECRLPTVEAEASILTIATRRLDETASVASFR